MAKPSQLVVAEYHKKLKDMKIRFPKESEEADIPDYAAIIKRQAEMLGKSANEYILDLIQEDIRSNPEGLKDSDFFIERDMKKITEKLKNSEF